MKRIEVKFVEILDAATCISALAIRVGNKPSVDDEVGQWEKWLLGRAGYGATPLIVLVNLYSMRCAYDPYSWGGRTMRAAHEHLARFAGDAEWHKLPSVVDVEFILGLTKTKKQSDIKNGMPTGQGSTR